MNNKNSHQSIGLVNRSLYYKSKDDGSYYNNITEILSGRTENILDVSSVLSIFMKNYIIGNSTLIDGIKKTDWLSKVDKNNELKIGFLAQHSDNKEVSTTIARKLKDALKRELFDFIEGMKTVGILLSGGMDSRIVAGILREAQLSGEFSGSVVAICWGDEKCRDVIYSSRIAKLFSWDFEHIPLTPETLYNNIFIAAERGAEYSPLHLHAMSSVSKIQGVDGILAASYGDSIGRGEYSGVKVNEISSLLSKSFNKYGFLKGAVEKKYLHTLRENLAYYHNKYPRNRSWEYHEIDHQAHYMRRHLSACMDVIDDKIPLYQMFTSVECYSLMFSLDPSYRTDEIYYELLKLLPGNLLDIPWARDGKLFFIGDKSVDSYNAEHNSYGKWLRENCFELVDKMFSSTNLLELGIINETGLNLWKKNWTRFGSHTSDRIDERICWLTSFDLFVDRYNVVSNESIETDYLDNLISSFYHFNGLSYKVGRCLLK